MVMVAIRSHGFTTLGVNVYSVVTVLSRAGLHVPVIPLVEVVGKAANESPEQIGAT